MRDSANIFRYDFATRKTTQITKLENEFAGALSNPRLLVRDGLSPSWR